MLGFYSVPEFVVYVTFIFFGMSVMNVTNAIYSIPFFFKEYYKFAQGDADVQPKDEGFWKHMFTYYNVVVYTMQVLLEAFMLTPLGRRFPIRWRLTFGLAVPIVEIIVILVIPVVRTSEDAAKAAMMMIAFIGGVSKTLCDSGNAALVGPFPTKFYGAVVWGLGISGLLTSFMSIIIKVSMDDSFSSLLTQSRIYFGLIMLLQVIACILLVLLRKNPYAMRYAAELRFDAKKSGTKDSNGLVDVADARGTGPADEECEREADERSDINVMNATTDPDTMRDTDQLENMTNAKQMLDASVMVVAKRIWPMLVSCFFVFFATLLVFPGVFFAVKTDVPSGWYFTIVAAMYNLGDFLSRLVLQFKRLHPSPRGVVIGTFSRLLVIPLLALCVYDVISGPWVPYVLCLIWGLTNGYFGGMSMIYGPRTGSLTTAGQRSLAAICINLALLLGLFGGAMSAMAVIKALPH
ncbi:adenosine transporter 1, putative [Trypanosoma brucei brucei TREU927]|uniref:Adenosine transporter 1, putative n=1 Tax=Trypanosoma brucei brucei (strain 927/4 GUTat10.1) TaxID=185431 RepID=Q581D7_TRYB2|nr:adenosine transporter 1, putative [Trypanosoma brucei brucei TREU927]AAX79600.1 adenosine transporter 1, putative [Trypanosoma brucei]AAZ11593.1 adenosine transporter 1, putative [Trypanosoma brucei brucei TREU927]